MTGIGGEKLLDRVLDLNAALRRAGLGATQAESIDALRALEHVDLLDRARLREALAAVTVTSSTDRQVFDALFDLYLPARPSRPGPGDPGPTGEDPADFLEELLEVLASGDEAALTDAARRAVDLFGAVAGRDGTVSHYRYRVLRALDPDRIVAQLLARLRAGAPHSALDERLLRDELDARVRGFVDDVSGEIRRRAADRLGADAAADRLVRPPLEERDLFGVTEEEQAELRAQVRPLARKLASRLAARRRAARRGHLDVRRTVRRSLATGGVPFAPVFRGRGPHRPELFVVCDLSGSVAAFARFTLMLVHALQEQFSRVRSFAFVDDLDEVTGLFADGDLAAAVERLAGKAALVHSDGHSDYGNAFTRFHERYLDDVTSRTTVLVLGDARGNYRQSGAWVVRELALRARRVYWLNPEPTEFWDRGDSLASAYAQHLDAMVEVRNLRQLAAFVERAV